MVSFDYGFYHIERVIRMIRGDAAALDEMDISGQGFWRSFAAILFVLPAYFFTTVLDAQEVIAAGVDLSQPYILTIQAIIELVLWMLPVLALVFVTRALGYADRYAHLIIVRNWLSVPFYYLVAAIALVGMVTGFTDESALLTLMLLAFIITILVRVTRMALNAPLSIAAALVIGEMVILLPLSIWLYTESGLFVETAS